MKKKKKKHMERKQTNSLQKNVHHNPKLNKAKKKFTSNHHAPRQSCSTKSIATHDTKTTKVWQTPNNEHSKD